jgi:hypothetical protein
MKNNKLISEALDLQTEVVTITSAAGATSKQYDLQNHHNAYLSANIVGDGAKTPVVIDCMESSVSTAGGSSALGSKSAITVGTSVATALPESRGVKSMTLIHGTDATGATSNPMRIGIGSDIRTFAQTTSTALLNSSAWSATYAWFGSTVASTVNTGETLRIDSLTTVLQSTLMFGDKILKASTPTTDSVQLTLNGHATGNFFFSATGSSKAVAIDSWDEAVGGFNVAADELDSTANKRYVSLKISTGATSLSVGVNVVRGPGRYGQNGFVGNVSTVNFAT